MSYCHLIGGQDVVLSNGFGAEVGAHILAQRNASACLTACSGPSCPANNTLSGNLSGTYQADILTIAANSTLTGNTIFKAEEIFMNGPFDTQTFTFQVDLEGCP